MWQDNSPRSGRTNPLYRAGRLLLAGWDLTRKVPGHELLEQSVQRVEQAVLAEIGHRIDQARDRAAGPAGPSDGREPSASQRLRSDMARLLAVSIDDDRERGHNALYSDILRRLTPDEARIIAAMSAGEVFPVVHVAARSALGGTGQLVLENASTVGKQAGIALLENVPGYLTRLRSIGLVNLGEEDESLAVHYDLLLTDQLVICAYEQARGLRNLTPKFIRQTVRLSALGQRFWAACDPSEGGQALSGG